MSKNLKAVNVRARMARLYNLSLFKADICFDSKRHIGCYVCSLYKCVEREL